MQRALELLCLCNADGVWSHIMICQDRLLAWSEDAGVFSLPGAFTVHEFNKNGGPVANTN